jgi:hypothetical protein
MMSSWRRYLFRPVETHLERLSYGRYAVRVVLVNL